MRTDVELLEHCHKIGRWLGFTVADNKLSKVYVKFSIVAYALAAIFTMRNRYYGFWARCTPTQIVIDCLEGSFQAYFLLIGFVRAFACRSNWIALFKTVGNIDEKYDVHVKSSTRSFVVKIVVYLVLITAIHLYDYSIWLPKVGVYEQWGYLIFRISTYYSLYVAVTTYSAALVVKNRLNHADKLIQNVIFNKLDFSELNNIKELLEQLHGIVVNCNEFIGCWSICQFIDSVLNCLDAMNTILIFSKENGEAFDIGLIIVNLGFSLMVSVSNSIIILSCDELEKMGEKMVTSCYLLEDVIEKSCLRNDIVFFVEIMEEFMPKFSAGGFFRINRSILSVFFSTLISYFVIVIQLTLAL